MYVERIATHGDHGYPGVDLPRLSPGLNVVTGPVPAALSSLADLTTHVLTGVRPYRHADRPWRNGDVYLQGEEGPTRLSRRGTADSPRLTAARRSAAVGEGTDPTAWRGDVPGSVVSAILFADGHTDPRRSLAQLLSAEVASAVRRLTAQRRAEPIDDGDLLRRRDDLLARIEASLGEQRAESTTLEQRLDELRSERASVADDAGRLRQSLDAVDAELGADESKRRYSELARIAEEAESRRSADGWSPRVEDLDSQITRWRATLAELDEREAYVHDELAAVRPDDASPEIALADQRASVAVAQRLVADLESEVARFAKSEGSPLCVCRDAHPRLNPLVETLAKHVARLGALVAQQDRALRSQELLDEAQQIARSKDELRRQIDKLLGRRETLWRTTRARTGREAYPVAPREDLPALEARRGELALQLAEAEQRLGRIDAEIGDLTDRRRRIFEPADLTRWREELAAIEGRLRVGSAASERPAPAERPLRASEVLAKLTDGELVELRLVAGGRSCEARTRRDRVVTQEEFGGDQLVAVVAALRIALADTLAVAGIATPLVLDDPFVGASDGLVANLATAIDDYRRRGRQAIVLTTNRVALDRFRSLGVEVLTMDSTAEPPPEPTLAHRRRKVEAPASRFVLDIEDSIERFPASIAGLGEAFRRARVATIRDLVVADPSAIAEELRLADVSAALVALWQAHTALVCFVPGLTFAEAKSLVAAGVLTVEDLADADAPTLEASLREGRFGWQSDLRVAEWIELATDELDRWRSTGLAEAWRPNRRERRERIRENASRRRRSTTREVEAEGAVGGRRRVRRERTAAEQGPRYYLSPDDDIEAAPSIGPKLAAQLKAIAVARVRDLLDGDPEAIAAGLEKDDVDAATIVAWQHQAELVCRVADLRGHDAQILVACGFTNADEIASMKPADLLEFVDPFCDTAEAQRLLRGSSRPDLSEVARWIEGARRRRTLATV